MLRLCSCRTQQRWENQEAVKMGNFLLYLTTRRSSLKEKLLDSGAFHTKCSNVCYEMPHLGKPRGYLPHSAFYPEWSEPLLAAVLEV